MTAYSASVTYAVDARTKRDAEAKARALAVGSGLLVASVTAERFPGGADYRVGWRVVVRLRGSDPA